MSARYVVHPMAVADALLSAADEATDACNQWLALALCDLAESVIALYESGFDGWVVR